MKADIKTTPPSWAPDAKPSSRGWVHPVTGELLVSVRGGCYLETDAIIDENVSEKVLDEKVDVVEIINEEPVPEEIIVDEEPKEVITETKKPAKKARKNDNVE